jgi:hypothetical protein
MNETNKTRDMPRLEETAPWQSAEGRSSFVQELKKELGLRSEVATRSRKYQEIYENCM